MIVYEIMVEMILFTANASFVDKKWRAPRLYDEKYMQNGSFVAINDLQSCLHAVLREHDRLSNSSGNGSS